MPARACEAEHGIVGPAWTFAPFKRSNSRAQRRRSFTPFLTPVRKSIRAARGIGYDVFNSRREKRIIDPTPGGSDRRKSRILTGAAEGGQDEPRRSGSCEPRR
jgi:hypothetical protein